MKIMDTSKEYIKMCEKAKEIQEAWKPQESDVIFSVAEKGIKYVSSNPHYWTNCDLIKDYQIIKNPKGIKTVANVWYEVVWLPRQDQLQEMVISKYQSIPTEKLRLYYLIKNIQIFQVKHTIGLEIKSMEFRSPSMGRKI